MDAIRRYYGVPAKRGMRVVFAGYPGTITGTTRSQMYLRLRMDNGERFTVHPTWEMQYSGAES